MDTPKMLQEKKARVYDLSRLRVKTENEYSGQLKLIDAEIAKLNTEIEQEDKLTN